VAGESELRDRLGALPLLSDVEGKRWPVSALLEDVQRHGSAAVVRDSVQPGGPPLEERRAFRLDPDVWSLLRAEVKTEDFTEEYQWQVAMWQRISRPTEVPWGEALVREAVEAEGLRGELGLGVPFGRGGVLLLSEGRPLARPLDVAQLPGLLGRLDGKLESDRYLERAVLSEAQRAAIAELYWRRLEAVLGIALRRQPGADDQYAAIVEYVAAYLSRCVAAARTSRRDLVARIRAGDRALPERGDEALGVKLLELAGGPWVDLRWVACLESPFLLLAPRDAKASPVEGATVVVGVGAATRALLQRVLGDKSVMSRDLWAGKRQGAAAKGARKKRVTKDQGERSGDLAVQSLLISTLRDAAGALAPIEKLGRAEIGRLKASPMKSKALVDRGTRRDHRLVLNSNHAVWKAARQALAGPEPGRRAVFHVAAAVVADLLRPELKVITPHEAVQLLHQLALLAGGRSTTGNGEQGTGSGEVGSDKQGIS
jgi:hypothetical protein